MLGGFANQLRDSLGELRECNAQFLGAALQLFRVFLLAGAALGVFGGECCNPGEA